MNSARGKMAAFVLKVRTMPSYKQQFADNLKKLREAAGLTQRSAAEAMEAQGVKCGHGKWSHWESGLASPPYDLLPAIAKTLGKKKISEIFP